MCGSEMVARAELHTRILATIFSGVLKLTLDAIEDSRRDRESVCIPKLAAFMRYMSTGSGEVAVLLGVRLAEYDL